jgi:DNA-directed RNA polymerase specialized sigma24 family protein
MTEQELGWHRKWLRFKYGNDDGEDIFQTAYMIAMERYTGIDRVNQNLFGLLCREAARVLLYHEKHEIPFSCLVQENNDQTDSVEFDPADEKWQKEYIAIEEREEIEKMHGKWLLNALLKAAEPKPSKVTPPHKNIQMELFAVV